MALVGDHYSEVIVQPFEFAFSEAGSNTENTRK